MNHTKLTEAFSGVCHQRPDRSFFFRGRQFPLCARCTGTAVGFASLPLFALHIVHLDLAWAFLLLLPAWADGTTQFFGWRESRNWLRLATGFLLGVSQVGFVAFAGDWVMAKLGILDWVLKN